MEGFPDCPFWDFSTAVYDRSGVAPACLGLQNRLGLDVNVLLFCCYAAADGHPPLGESAIRIALQAIEPWHRDVVTKLREMRRALKGRYENAPKAVAAALRDRTLTLEIDSEHVEQLILAAQLDQQSDSTVAAAERPGVAATNLRDYLSVTSVTPGADDLEDLASVLRGCFEGIDGAVLSDAIGAPAP